jgi:hypothetical protein
MLSNTDGTRASFGMELLQIAEPAAILYKVIQRQIYLEPLNLK